ncbi:MAG: TIGR00266 family protein [Negativicutes bacterium]|nr:TIGR00266 family protein [Negativicutes bacterium]
MADRIDYRIMGEEMQMVEIELAPGEGVRAEAGAMLFMEEGIEMHTGVGGLFSGLKRIIAGEGFFITTFINGSRVRRRCGFAAPYPGKIIALDLSQLGGVFYCQKESFLCAARGVDVGVAFAKKIGAGLFGGEGFVLQKLSGEGQAFIHAGGGVIVKNLVPGETIRLDTGCLVAFAPSVNYDIQFIGGFRNALFGGEGLVLAKLRGPGQVYLQTLPFSRLADRILAAGKSMQSEK